MCPGGMVASSVMELFRSIAWARCVATEARGRLGSLIRRPQAKSRPGRESLASWLLSGENTLLHDRTELTWEPFVLERKWQVSETSRARCSPGRAYALILPRSGRIAPASIRFGLGPCSAGGMARRSQPPAQTWMLSEAMAARGDQLPCAHGGCDRRCGTLEPYRSRIPVRTDWP